MKKKWIVLPLALLACFWAIGNAFATTLIVPDQYYSVQLAINAAQSGDTVFVRGGTYVGDIVMKNNVDLVGEGSDVTTLKMTTTYLKAGNNALIEGFTITGYGIYCYNKSPVIQNNIIRDTSNYAVYIVGNSWPTIFKNYIYNNREGISSNGTATIVNNTIVGKYMGIGIRTVFDSGFPIMNNLVLNHNYGIYGSGYNGYTGGHNNVYGSRYDNFRYLLSSPSDIQQDPLLTRAPIAHGFAWRTEQTAGGWDTVYIKYSDVTSQYAVGDYVEIGNDKVVRQLTDVSYVPDGNYGWNSTRLIFDPPLASSNGSNVDVWNWGSSSDFTYDFTYQPGSPCIDGGNPDSQYLDADGSINDIGAAGGTSITPSYDPTPPAAVSNFSISAGDAEATLSWTPPAEANLRGYIVLRTSGAAVDGVPVDGTSYAVFGSSSYQQKTIGNAQVVYAGQDPLVSSFTDSDLMPGVEYHYDVYAVNEFYIYSPPAAGSVVTTHTPQTFTVAPDGSGDFATIGDAVTFAKPSDTVYLSAGQYREEISFKNGVHLVGESMNSVTLLPLDGSYKVIGSSGCEYGSVESMTINNDQTSGNQYAIYQESASNLDVKNVRIEGFSTAIWYRGVAAQGDYYSGSRTAVVENSIFANNGTAIYCYQGMSPKITNNTFTNNSGSGIYGKYYCNSEVTANHFEGNGRAVYVWEHSNMLIADNIMLRNSTGIGHAWDSHTTVLRNLISESVNNGIYAVSRSSPSIVSNIISKNGGDGLWLFLNWPRAYNNTIVENVGNGLTIQYYGSVDTRNNIIAFNGGWGTYAGENYYRGYPNLYFNDVFSNGLGDTSPYSRVYEGNIFADPLFVNAAEGNYQLSTPSPCIDAGDPNPIYNDLDGSPNDMGAYGGPEAMVGDEPTIDEEISQVVTTLVTLPENAFKNEPADRKGSLEEKFDEVLTLISAGGEEVDPLVAETYYTDALNKLENDLLKKCDGHFGGNINNDWITSFEAQSVVYPMIIDLINEVEMLLTDLSN